LKFGVKDSSLWSFESLKFGAKSSSFYGHLNHYNLESKALHFMVLDSFAFTLTCFFFVAIFFWIHEPQNFAINNFCSA
jgi:hypothetical protein